jgi:hypothetical protein
MRRYAAINGRSSTSGGWPIQAKTGLEWATFLLRFAEQEVNMLRHGYVSVNLKSEAAAHSLQC